MPGTTERFTITVKEDEPGTFLVDFEPVPVMPWYHIVAAREEFRSALYKAAGNFRDPNISRNLFNTAKECLNGWRAKRWLVSQSYFDDDQYMRLIPQPD